MKFFEKSYLNYRIDNMKIELTPSKKGTFVVDHPNFPKLHIEEIGSDQVVVRLKKLIKMELEAQPIEMIDYFFELWNK
ncbi:hypothetical protein E3J79_03170 [Candidatus Dependentiae bacterium]|nr:MAG: hypothetical protein E3J79_03170 [Candidatus Dependentiae bacterium]